MEEDYENGVQRDLEKFLDEFLNKKIRPTTTVGLCESGCRHFSREDEMPYCTLNDGGITSGFECEDFSEEGVQE